MAFPDWWVQAIEPCGGWRQVPSTAPHVEVRFVRGFTPFRVGRGVYEVWGTHPHLCFKVRTLRFRDDWFLQVIAAS